MLTKENYRSPKRLPIRWVVIHKGPNRHERRKEAALERREARKARKLAARV